MQLFRCCIAAPARAEIDAVPLSGRRAARRDLNRSGARRRLNVASHPQTPASIPTRFTPLTKGNRSTSIDSCSILLLAGHTDWVRTVAIAMDGTWLATASYDKTLRVWDVAERRTVAVVRAEGELYSCAWGEVDHELAAGGERGVYLFALLT
ncbi:WD40 repeat domain-containing protein [Streptomyces sp. NPDC054932]